MRVAFFLEIFYPEINGVITATLDLAKNLKALGHHALLVVPDNRKAERVREVEGIEVYRVPAVPFPLYPGMFITRPWDRGLLAKLREDRIDILHITGPWTMGWAGITMARKLGLPLVQTFHTMLGEDTYILYLVKFRFLLPLGRAFAWGMIDRYIGRSDLVTTPSRFARDELAPRYPGKRLEHISNGIDFSRFRNAPSREEFLCAHPWFNHKTFLFVGRIGLEKSIDVLLRGFARAAARDPEIRLALVGDGPNRGELERLAEELGLAGKARFLGRILHEELLRSGLLHYARGFVTASVTENQPMTVIEAICCGLPLVTADVPGMRELAQGNALTCPPGDAEAFGDALARLAGDDGLHRELAEKSRVLAERFDGRTVAQTFLERYRELLRRP